MEEALEDMHGEYLEPEQGLEARIKVYVGGRELRRAYGFFDEARRGLARALESHGCLDKLQAALEAFLGSGACRPANLAYASKSII